MADCKTPEQIAAEAAATAAAAKIAAMEAEIDRLKAEQKKWAGQDKTDMKRGPVGIPGDDSEATCEGLFIPEWQAPTSEDVPVQEISIKKDKLLRIPEGFLARFKFHLDAPGKIVGDFYLDGKPMGKDDVSGFGTNLPFQKGDGYIDLGLPEWPNTAKALKPITHEISIRYGVVTGIAYGSKGTLGLLTWGLVKAQKQAVFKVTILPGEILD